MAPKPSKNMDNDHNSSRIPSKKTINKPTKAKKVAKGRDAGPASSSTPLTLSGGATAAQIPKSVPAPKPARVKAAARKNAGRGTGPTRVNDSPVKVTAIADNGPVKDIDRGNHSSIKSPSSCNDGSAEKKIHAQVDGSQQSTNTVGSGTVNPRSISGGSSKPTMYKAPLGGLAMTVLRTAQDNLRSHAGEVIELDDDATPAVHVAMASPIAPNQAPVLYDYQVDRIAKSLEVAKRTKEEEEKFNNHIPDFDYLQASTAGRLILGPVHAPEMGGGIASSPGVGIGAAKTNRGAPPKKETIEDIRRNMVFLDQDGPISDRAFAEMHYGSGARPSNQALRHALAPFKEKFKDHHPTFTRQHTKFQFLEQRADSSAHALSNGENLPGYAYNWPEIGKNGQSASETFTASEEAAAKSAQQFDEANRKYDDAFERNLGETFN